MSSNTTRMLRPVVLLLALCAAASASAASSERKETLRAGKARSLSVDNIAGRVLVQPGSGNEISVAFTVVGGGDDDAEAKAMAQRIKFETSQDGDRYTIRVRYPTEDFREYFYDDGRGGRNNTQSTYMGERVRVTSARGRGADLHVDAVVTMPKGTGLRFSNLVGELRAEKVIGDLDLGSGSGAVSSQGGQGRFEGDTGSGSVDVSDHSGEVEADTGSGEVTLERVKGNVKADTGSGEINLRQVTGRIDVDTGSGGVELEDSSGSLDVDTGSGGVRARNFIAGERLHIDTGSGGARIQGDLGAVRDLKVETGSGSVTLDSTTPFDFKLRVSVGSGGVDVDATGLRDVRNDEEDGEYEATFGQGQGRAEIETGSGGVRIRVGTR